MAARYFVDAEGRYLGAFDGVTPSGGIEVAAPPHDASDTWDGSQWAPATVTPSMTVAQIIKAFTPDQRAALLTSTKIQAFMWGATADQTIAADNPLLAEAIQVAVTEQLLGPDTQEQIEVALAPLLS